MTQMPLLKPAVACDIRQHTSVAATGAVQTTNGAVRLNVCDACLKSLLAMGWERAPQPALGEVVL